jgi:hypothetical protein
MAKFGIIAPDVLGFPGVVWSADSEASASLAAQNLATNRLWQKWRSSQTGPQHLLDATFTKAPDFKLNRVALLGTNLVRGNGEVCCFLGADDAISGLPFQERVADAVVDSNNITGSFGDVDEGVTAPNLADFIVPTTTAAAHVTFGFQNPSSDLKSGARYQSFALIVGADGDTTGANLHKRVSVTATMYESGSPVLALGTKTVHGTAAHSLFFSFDASLLAAISGANLQLRIDFNSSAAYSVKPKLYAVSALVMRASIFTDSDYVADSGFSLVSAEPTSGTGADYRSPLVQPTRWSYQFGSMLTASHVKFLIREDHVPLDVGVEMNTFALPIPPTYVEVGKGVAGPWWSPTINRATGQYVTLDPRDTVVETVGGGVFGTARPAGDTFRVFLEWLTAADAAFLRSFYRDRKTISPFYADLEPESATEIDVGGWVRFVGPISFTRRRGDVYTHSAELTLRLTA